MITTIPNGKNWKAQRYSAVRRIEDAKWYLDKAHEALSQLDEVRTETARLSLPVELLNLQREINFNAMLSAHREFTELRSKFIEDYGKPFDSKF